MKTEIHKRRMKKRRRYLFCVILAVVIAAGAGGIYLHHKLGEIQVTALNKKNIAKNNVSEKEFKGYTTIALFGLDNRTQGVYKSGNSDVIMIMSIDNDTQKVKLVSLYRDTYLNVSKKGEASLYRKANAAYALGGAEEAETMLNRNLDLEINNYVTFDFGAVAEAIDILGGVKINIESEAELKYLNEYITYTNHTLKKNVPFVRGVGEHTLNGVQAVAYSRIRYTKGNDFRRAQRQRVVLSKMISKAKKANLIQLNQLTDTVFPDIKTDLSRQEMLTMMKAMLGYKMSDSCGFPFYRTTKTMQIQVGKRPENIVIPCDLETNVILLHKILYKSASYKPTDTIQSFSTYIEARTGETKEDAMKDTFSYENDNGASIRGAS